MKKVITILLLVTLIMCFALVFVGCSNNQTTTQYKVTIIQLNSAGRPAPATEEAFYIKADTPMGNNFKYLTRSATEYKFYTDIACTSQWDLVKDKVNCDMTLYAVKG